MTGRDRRPDPGKGNPMTMPSGDAGASAGADPQGSAGSEGSGQTGTEGTDPEGALAEAVTAGATDGMTPEEAIAHWEAEAAKWKAQSRKHEDRSREGLKAQKELKAIKDEQLTEQQRLEQTATEANNRAVAAESRASRLSAITDYQLLPAGHSAEDRERVEALLGTGTEEEIRVRAEGLAAMLNGRGTGTANGADPTDPARVAAIQAAASGRPSASDRVFARRQRPVESLRPGGAPASTSTAADPNDRNAMFRDLVSERLDARR